jgi:hypothetical protein
MRLQDAQQKIVALLAGTQLEPDDLFARLADAFDDATIRDATLDLIERARVEWTPKRFLVLLDQP